MRAIPLRTAQSQKACSERPKFAPVSLFATLLYTWGSYLYSFLSRERRTQGKMPSTKYEILNDIEAVMTKAQNERAFWHLDLEFCICSGFGA